MNSWFKKKNSRFFEVVIKVMKLTTEKELWGDSFGSKTTGF